MRSRSRLGPLVLSVAVLACSSPRDPAPAAPAPSVAPAWPELPRTPEAAEELIRTRTARPLNGAETASTSAEALLQALDERPSALVAGEWTTEATLGAQLALTDPLLIPLDREGTEIAILYPDGPLAATMDRVRAEASTGKPGLRVHVLGATGTLHIGDRALPIGPDPQRIEIPAGEHAYVLAVGSLRFAGAIHLPPGGGLELSFDPARRAVALTERPPPAGARGSP